MKTVTPELIAKFTALGMSAGSATRMVKELVKTSNDLEKQRDRAKANKKYWNERLIALEAELAAFDVELTP